MVKFQDVQFRMFVTCFIDKIYLFIVLEIWLIIHLD